MYFDPFSLQLGVNNKEVLVDGAIIAENPSLYSTFMAKELGDKQKFVRVVSLGSGINDFSGINFNSGGFVRSVLDDPNYVINYFNYVKSCSHSYFT